jgi:hypothetical protein
MKVRRRHLEHLNTTDRVHAEEGRSQVSRTSTACWYPATTILSYDAKSRIPKPPTGGRGTRSAYAALSLPVTAVDRASRSIIRGSCIDSFQGVTRRASALHPETTPSGPRSSDGMSTSALRSTAMIVIGSNTSRITSVGRLLATPPSTRKCPSGERTGGRMPGMATLERTALHTSPVL